MGVKYYGISTGKFRRYHSSTVLNIIDLTTFFKNFRDLFGFLGGIKNAFDVLSYEKPDVVFAKGGFVSLPVGIAAKMAKVPLVVHESDAVMGLANRNMAKFATKVCVSFPKKYYEDIKKEKLEETGNPVREDILMGDSEKLRREIGFEKERKTILVMGGSQGSLFINETVLGSLTEILLKYQLIWLTGERDYDFIKNKVKKIDKELQKHIKLYGFVSGEMADIYALSNLAVCRSGSNVLFELAAVGKPAIFIPHDVSPGSHQFANARIFTRSGAGYLMKQDTLTPKKLYHQINYLLENEKEMAEMSEKIRSLADTGAAQKVAGIIYNLGEENLEQNRKNKDE